jgi:hypothetical protein
MPRFAGHFYVQDVRYAAGAGLRRSGDVQDVRVGSLLLDFLFQRQSSNCRRWPVRNAFELILPIVRRQDTGLEPIRRM